MALLGNPVLLHCFLSAAVFCEIGVLENTKLVRVIVLSVALLTTYSTMGYIVLPLIILSLSRQRTDGKRNILIIAAVMILLFRACCRSYAKYRNRPCFFKA